MNNPMKFWIKEKGDQYNIGLVAERIGGTGGWDDLMLPKHEPLKVIEYSAYDTLESRYVLATAHLHRELDDLKSALRDIAKADGTVDWRAHRAAQALNYDVDTEPYSTKTEPKD